MKKLITSLFSVLLIYNLSISQQKGPVISFEKEIHDFGNINEEKGPVTYKFIFTNTGAEPLIIRNVKADCGCTTPGWSKEPILPGKKGFVSAQYNPKNRPNTFNKNVTVQSNATPESKSLRIKGNVIPKPKEITDIYPYDMQGLRMKSPQIPINRIAHNAKKTVAIEVVNNTNSPQELTFKNIPNHIKIIAEPSTLKPKEKGNITATFDANLKNDWGYVNTRVNVNINGKSDKKSYFNVSATIYEDFSQLTEEEKANAPKIEFKEKLYDFGQIKQRTNVEHDFVFTNTGKSDLLIRKVNAGCGCTAVTPKETTIPPGGTSSIKAIFKSGTHKKSQTKSIDIYINDPTQSNIKLRIKAFVIPPEEQQK